MVCDSASIHGRYTGDEIAPLTTASQSAARQSAVVSQPAAAPAVPAKPVPPAAKKSIKRAGPSTEGKSTSFWDDSLAAPAGKHTVSTADFSVAAPSLPADADEAGTSGAKPVGSSGDPRPDHAAGSRAGLVVGMVIGLAMSAVVWRRRRHSGECEAN